MVIENYHYESIEEEISIVCSIYDECITIYDAVEAIETLTLKYFDNYSVVDVYAIISLRMNPCKESEIKSKNDNNTTNHSCTTNEGNMYLYILIPKSYPTICSTCYLHIPVVSCYQKGYINELNNYIIHTQMNNDIAVLINLFESYANSSLPQQQTQHTTNTKSIQNTHTIEIDNDTQKLMGQQLNEYRKVEEFKHDDNGGITANQDSPKITDFNPEYLNSISDNIIDTSSRNLNKQQPFLLCKTKDNIVLLGDRLKHEFDRDLILCRCLMHNCDHCSGTVYGQFGNKNEPKMLYFKQYIIDIKSLALLKTYSIDHLVNHMFNINQEIGKLKPHNNPFILDIYSSKKVFYDEKIFMTFFYDFNYLSYRTMSNVFANSSFGITEIIIHKYAVSILKALDYLHKNDMYYGQLEPCNILVNSNGELLLFDVFSFDKLTCVEHHFTKNYCNNSFKYRHFSTFSNRIYPKSAHGDIYAYGLILLSLYKGFIINEAPAIVPNILPNVIQFFINKCLKASEDHKLLTANLLNDYYIVHFEPMPNIWAGHSTTPQSPNNEANYVMECVKKSKFPKKTSLPKLDVAITCFGPMVNFDSTLGMSRVENEFQSFTSIGSGGFGSVISARNKLDSCVYAIKRIKLPHKNPKKLQTILKEVQILSKLNHENIVRYYNSWIGPDTNKQIFPPIEGEIDELGNEIESESTTPEESYSTERSYDFSDRNMLAKTDDGNVNDNVETIGENFGVSTHGHKYKSDTNFNDKNKNYIDRSSLHYSVSDDSEIEQYSGYSKYSDSSSDGIIFKCSSGDIEYYNRAISLIKMTESDVETSPVFRSRHRSKSNCVNNEVDIERNTSCISDTKTGNIENTEMAKKDTRKRIYFYIQMEYCEKKTLYEVIEMEELFKNNDRIMKLFRGILEGITYVHEKGLIHRDLKPGNIFISINDNPKIGDFGLARLKTSLKGPTRQTSIDGIQLNPIISKNKNNTTDVSTTNSIIDSVTIEEKNIKSMEFMGSLSSYDDSYNCCAGTYIYSAPELNVEHEKKPKATPKSDVYSLGIVFYEMIHPPFNTKFERIINITALKSDENFLPTSVSEKTYFQLLDMMLKKNPDQRANARTLLEHNLVPANMDDCKFTQAINQVLNDRESHRFKIILSLLFDRKRLLLSPSSMLNNNNPITFSCHDFAFLGAKSLAWNCLYKYLEYFSDQNGAVSLHLPEVISDVLVYHSFLFDLQNDNEFLTISKSGDLFSLTSTYIKRLGYYLANMEYSRIPINAFSLMSGIIYYPQFVNKLVVNNIGTSNKQKCLQKCEYNFSQVVVNDIMSISDSLLNVISKSILFVRGLFQKVNKINSKMQIGSDKNKKIRFLQYSQSSELTIVLNHYGIIGKFLINNGFPSNTHLELAYIIASTKKDEKRSQLFQSFAKFRSVDSATRSKVYQFLNFRGSFDEYKTHLQEPIYVEYLDQLEIICKSIENLHKDNNIEICVDFLSSLSLNAGYLSFNVEIRRLLSKNHSRTTDILITGGVSSTLLHKHVTYTTNGVNVSPFCIPTSESLGFTVTTSQDDMVIAYSSTLIEPILYLCILMHREECCIIDDACSSRKLLVLAFVKNSTVNLSVEDKQKADLISHEIGKVSNLCVHILEHYISHETPLTLKTYYNYLNLGAFVLFDVNTDEYKILIYECGKKTNEHKFVTFDEVVDYLKTRTNYIYTRKDDAYSHDNSKSNNVTSSDVTVTHSCNKKPLNDINYICILSERSCAQKRKLEIKTSVTVKPILAVISHECKVNVFLTELNEDEFNYFIIKVSQINFNRNWNFKREIEKDQSVHFNSTSKTRLGNVYDGIAITLDKNSATKSAKPSICVIYSIVIDRAKLLL